MRIDVWIEKLIDVASALINPSQFTSNPWSIFFVSVGQALAKDRNLMHAGDVVIRYVSHLAESCKLLRKRLLMFRLDSKLCNCGIL